MKKIATVAAALLLVSTAHAAGTTPSPVQLDCKADNNPIGQRMCYQLREDIAQSATFREVQQPPSLVAHLMFMDPDAPNGQAASPTAGSRSIYSLTITYTAEVTLNSRRMTVEEYLTHAVGIVGSGRVEESSQDILADLSQAQPR